MNESEAVHWTLSLVKTPEEVEAWLHTRQRALDGCRPCDLMAAGRADRVLPVAERLALRQRKATRA